MFFYRLTCALVKALYSFLFHLEFTGEENIPKEGGIIFCGNHKSNHDPVIMSIAQKRPLSFMAKDSMFRFPPFAFVLKHLGVFPVKRGSGDIGAIKKAIEIIQGGNALTMFPEGTRNKTENLLLEFKTGAALVAKKGNGKLIPVAISGNYRLFSTIKVQFGTPVSPEDFGEKPDLNEVTQAVKNQVFQMLTNGGSAESPDQAAEKQTYGN